MCVEGIIEMLSDPIQVKKMSIKDKGIVFGILAEKAELLSGSPTARLQTIGAPPAVEVIEYLNWLRSEYARRIDLGEGKEKERAAIGGAGQVAAAMLPAAAGQAGADPGEPALAAGPMEDQGPGAIVDPGASEAIGQTTHQHDDVAMNIDRNEGG